MDNIFRILISLFSTIAIFQILSVMKVDGQSVDIIQICEYLNATAVDSLAARNSDINVIYPPLRAPGGIYFTLASLSDEYATGETLTGKVWEMFLVRFIESHERLQTL